MAKATGPTYKVAYRRRRASLTNYTKRLPMIKGETPRLVVRKSGKHILVQVVKFETGGDEVIARAHSSELSQYGWMAQSNAPTSYLVGMLAGSRAKKAGQKGFHLDIGMNTPSLGNTLYCAAYGARDAGLECALKDGLVEEGRISGKHIADYASKLKGEGNEKYAKQFSQYMKANIDITQLPKLFEGVKAKLKQ